MRDHRTMAGTLPRGGWLHVARELRPRKARLIAAESDKFAVSSRLDDLAVLHDLEENGIKVE